jgi:hypothetical protein
LKYFFCKGKIKTIFAIKSFLAKMDGANEASQENSSLSPGEKHKYWESEILYVCNFFAFRM